MAGCRPLEQAQFGLLHELKGQITLSSRHLLAVCALRDQAGEFG
jgi:hypothetical protein